VNVAENLPPLPNRGTEPSTPRPDAQPDLDRLVDFARQRARDRVSEAGRRNADEAAKLADLVKNLRSSVEQVVDRLQQQARVDADRRLARAEAEAAEITALSEAVLSRAAVVAERRGTIHLVPREPEAPVPPAAPPPIPEPVIAPPPPPRPVAEPTESPIAALERVRNAGALLRDMAGDLLGDLPEPVEPPKAPVQAAPAAEIVVALPEPPAAPERVAEPELPPAAEPEPVAVVETIEAPRAIEAPVVETAPIAPAPVQASAEPMPSAPHSAIRVDNSSLGAIDIVAGPFTSFYDLGELTRVLREIPGVASVIMRRLSRGTVYLKVDYDGATAFGTPLAEAVRGSWLVSPLETGWQLTSVNAASEGVQAGAGAD
jgi:hypothetical protein